MEKGSLMCDVCKRHIEPDEIVYVVRLLGAGWASTEERHLCKACWQKMRRFLEGEDADAE